MKTAVTTHEALMSLLCQIGMILLGTALVIFIINLIFRFLERKDRDEAVARFHELTKYSTARLDERKKESK